jgi:tetratricopeptide (TPR) repeat protein
VRKIKRQIKVFIASPGDLAVERQAFRDQIKTLNEGFGEGARVEFVALGWEDTLATTGRRPQSIINADIDACDIFVLMMHRRWGQPAPDSEFSSYTEEEFQRALAGFNEKRKPEIFVFLKTIEAAQMGDPGEQLKKVLAFRKQLEDSNTVLYRNFDDQDQFAGEVDRHLRSYALNELPKPADMRKALVLPIEYVEKVSEAEARAKSAEQKASENNEKAEAAAARADAVALGLAKRAAASALEGKIEEARQDFALSIAGTTNLRVLYLAFEFYNRIGELTEAEDALNRWLAISGEDNVTSDTAAALGSFGQVYRTRGELDKAEEAYRMSLEINEQLGHEEGIANQRGNLGLIYHTRGDLDKAEEAHKKALEIDERLGRHEGIARHWGNLGLVHQTRGDLDKAEEAHKKALEIAEGLGLQEGIAADWCNLGSVYQARGDLDKAEGAYRMSLEINERLGRQEGIAKQWTNLGAIFKTRGDLNKAEQVYKRSFEINERLGRQEGIAINSYNLGILALLQRSFDDARKHFTAARRAYDKMGLRREVADCDERLAECDNH